MSLVKFAIFHKVVELGSLTKAGEELNLSQSAVSHAIASLEDNWGFSILHRGRSGITLTSNGERVLQYIKEILQSYEEMEQEIADMNGLEIGTVRIGTFSSVSVQWLPEILKQFSRYHPTIEIELFEGDYAEIEEWIFKGEVDFGFVSIPTSYHFEVIPLKKDRMLCIFPEDHPLAHKKEVSFSEIAEEPLIRAKKGSDNDLKRILKENNVVPNVKFELEDDQAIFSMVQHGMGISILPEMALYRLPKNIRVLNLEKESYRTIGIAAKSFNNLAPATKKFIEYLKPWSRHVHEKLPRVEE
ncbi:DNA-binding transcriptional LysR family regulator [Cerasibacillus quisquiliarum]|uniref:LysR family transcriptional regulator n=1 Tax=Cerasibacillus quisquiliarum TaxID=227865 RepID=A0A511UZQ9_9BACI|nr:LysR family transcriptional regulator [Cerasibacillus quisquiliarum]MBB5147294.1 DNA-binding transcriptional LysR family regulator [Cerasibacillus quisquiliarum]GEN32137.1 LysR family transcriptional regulator [Cerasibacillus quisquiliarum]